MLDNVPDGLVGHVEPVEDSVENGPQYGMVEYPRHAHGDGKPGDREMKRTALWTLGTFRAHWLLRGLIFLYVRGSVSFVHNVFHG
jgi:hypothetical protein